VAAQHTVIDIFAGPGGLSEGFSSLELRGGCRPFQIGLSAEMEFSAHSTLSLRSLFRRCLTGERALARAYFELVAMLASNPSADLAAASSAVKLGAQWAEVRREALQITLGTEEGHRSLRERLVAISKARRDGLVLIGGPPCQAYSLVGRARNRGISGYRPEDDKRHFLYQEYLSILSDFQPDVFIMENVKGILSSAIAGVRMFEKILDDLRRPAGPKGPIYDLVPLAPLEELAGAGNLWPAASDFVIRSEEFGVPQSRHRVIILGILRGTAPTDTISVARLQRAKAAINLEDVLTDLPRLRSGLSRSEDSGKAWAKVMRDQQTRLIRCLRKGDPELSDFVAGLQFTERLARSSKKYRPATMGPSVLRQYYRNPNLGVLLNHETRGHMEDDLRRYLFCASHAAVYGRSPSSPDFPDDLKPAHKSWDAGHFADRFRVQMGHLPASTITSHLAKDGHHFIHWDPRQCRSLTVREAARAQTFPDDYVFLGNRTQQYTQVGNAVPPILARQIAAVVAALLQ
jgi:DNA (cytosine-5)-methyltransferase 1